MRMKAGLTVLGLMLAVIPAHAQRAAISPDLSPADAAAAFEAMVVDGCLAAVASGGRVSDTSISSHVTAAQDSETLRQAGAAPGDTVWDVSAARGVVTVRESGGRCIVQVYGPPAPGTVSALARRLKEQGFEALASAGGGLSQTLLRGEGASRVQVTVQGAEPGGANHPSRFSVISATVSRVN